MNKQTLENIYTLLTNNPNMSMDKFLKHYEPECDLDGLTAVHIQISLDHAEEFNRVYLIHPDLLKVLKDVNPVIIYGEINGKHSSIEEPFNDILCNETTDKWVYNEWLERYESEYHIINYIYWDTIDYDKSKQLLKTWLKHEDDYYNVSYVLGDIKYTVEKSLVDMVKDRVTELKNPV